MTRLVTGFVVAALVAPLVAQEPLVFRKVDYFQMEDGEEKTRDARLVLDPVGRVITIADEKKGAEKAVYAEIPYGSVKKVVYELSSHRRYGAAVLVSPLFVFTRGKKHWLTIEFENVTSLPQGFVYMRLDKDNVRQIRSALEAGLGLEIEELTEDAKD